MPIFSDLIARLCAVSSFKENMNGLIKGKMSNVLLKLLKSKFVNG